MKKNHKTAETAAMFEDAANGKNPPEEENFKPLREIQAVIYGSPEAFGINPDEWD
ncbi:MAG: hypothetical protein IJ666_06535 [Ruminococcus sp.]|nr:hypothetical protein [Ruminococcus sp.]